MCICFNTLPADAVTKQKLTINYPDAIPSYFIEHDLKYTSNCKVNCSKSGQPVAFPWIPIKVVVWMLKFAPPAYSPPDPNLSLLGIAGNELSGNILMGSSLRSGFRQKYDLSSDTLESSLDLANLDPDIPSLYSPPYLVKIEETITGGITGRATGNGIYFVNDIFIGNYNVDYIFNGSPTSNLSSPIEIKSLFKIDPGSSAEYVSVNEGFISGTNIPCPVPAPLPLFGITAAFGWARKLRKYSRISR
jgi:hypothetical protein